MSNEIIKKDSIRDLIQNPGDKLEIKITKTKRMVAKLNKDNEEYKYSETYYPATDRIVRVESKKRS